MLVHSQDPVPVDMGSLAFVGLALLLGGLALAPLGVELARRISPGRRPFFARWGFTHLARLVLAFLLAEIGLHLIWRMWESPSLVSLLVRSSLTFAVAAAVALAVAKSVMPEGVAALGLRRGGNGRAVCAGLVVYVMCLPAILGAGFLWPFVIDQLGGDCSSQHVLDSFLNSTGLPLAAALVLAVLVQPFLEELVFRGFLQPLLVQNLHDRGGVVMTSLLFARLHGTDAFLPIFLLSLVLGGVMLRTGRLLAVWAVHALHNGLMLALVLGSETWREMLLP